MGIASIIDGHTKELFGLNEDISEIRLKICHSCPLYKNSLSLGAICNSKKWINLETGDTSLEQKDGYVNGCGCRLNAKSRLPYASCPINKW